VAPLAAALVNTRARNSRTVAAALLNNQWITGMTSELSDDASFRVCTCEQGFQEFASPTWLTSLYGNGHPQFSTQPSPPTGCFIMD
jgi:hypothetical protein